MLRAINRSVFNLGFFLLGAGFSSQGLACGGMNFPGSLLCSPVGTLVTLGTISRPVSPTAYPPNFVKNKGGGYTAVWPNQVTAPSYSTGYSPQYAYPSLGYPSYSYPSYSYPSYSYPSTGYSTIGYPSYSYPSFSYPSYSTPSCLSPSLTPSMTPSLGGGLLLMPSSGFGGGTGSCGTSNFAPTGPYFGLGSYGGYAPSSSYFYPSGSSCGSGSLVYNHGGSSCGSSSNFASSLGNSPRVVCVMCGLARNFMRPISRARTLHSNRFY